jgi:hypothetical protein
LQLYGIDPPTGQTRTFDMTSGNTGNPDICGAFVVKTITGNGNTT